MSQMTRGLVQNAPQEGLSHDGWQWRGPGKELIWLSGGNFGLGVCVCVCVNDDCTETLRDNKALLS